MQQPRDDPPPLDYESREDTHHRRGLPVQPRQMSGKEVLMWVLIFVFAIGIACLMINVIGAFFFGPFLFGM